MTNEGAPPYSLSSLRAATAEAAKLNIGYGHR